MTKKIFFRKPITWILKCFLEVKITRFEFGLDNLLLSLSLSLFLTNLLVYIHSFFKISPSKHQAHNLIENIYNFTTHLGRKLHHKLKKKEVISNKWLSQNHENTLYSSVPNISYSLEGKKLYFKYLFKQKLRKIFKCKSN